MAKALLQLREQVHAISIGRWPLFGAQITDLTDHLDPARWPHTPRRCVHSAKGQTRRLRQLFAL
ncbi:hypothetical protein CEP88_19980 [Roseobacter denitrificans]|uniref:Uncharacterized protein n=1 Tax=Roseobacter denitrificans (strain ATCC 33942 / OCh 114) TaxID=375451 RepID=Q168D3_ROSDO|nr:hypothetical protein [Roseobacter denitrificans]ABG31660.1 hypothetical protein RD1_2058 [Roseobacter denitrificans OCh 114]AVL54637.1 hypothetical protein CEP88_19980 [Roseobacter denitrificans]